MRTITLHQTNAANEAIEIRADERDPKNGNASHEYQVRYTTPSFFVFNLPLKFQHGPIGEVGINGITNEALLAVVADRLEGFQEGPFACEENARALASVLDALGALKSRTQKRMDRGVEGRNLP